MILKSVHTVLAELFGSHIINFFTRIGDFNMVANRLNQMSFTMTSRSMDEERVVHNSGFFNHRLGGRMGQFVKGTHNKCFKSVARI